MPKVNEVKVEEMIKHLEDSIEEATMLNNDVVGLVKKRLNDLFGDKENLTQIKCLHPTDIIMLLMYRDLIKVALEHDEDGKLKDILNKHKREAMEWMRLMAWQGRDKNTPMDELMQEDLKEVLDAPMADAMWDLIKSKAPKPPLANRLSEEALKEIKSDMDEAKKELMYCTNVMDFEEVLKDLMIHENCPKCEAKGKCDLEPFVKEMEEWLNDKIKSLGN